MANTDNPTHDHQEDKRIVLILLGAISGILSLAIMADYIQANEWLAPILGVLAILLLMSGGLIGGKDQDSNHTTDSSHSRTR